MKLLPSAVVLSAVAMLVVPAHAIETAPATAPADPAAVATVQAEAPPLPPQPAAIQSALEQAGQEANARERAILEGVSSFYAARSFEPIWIRDGRAGGQMTALRRRMDAAAARGLDPAAYETPEFAQSYPADPQVVAAAEVAFSRAAVRFVMHLAGGRIRPTEISSIITLDPYRPEAGAILSQLSSADSMELALNAFEPPHPQYRALQAKLAELRATEAGPAPVVVPEGALLKPGSHDPRVPLLRERLGATLAEDADPELYDIALIEAVTAFQAENGLTADGILGPRTLMTLNGPSRENDIAAIVVNMERWRWMPRDLGTFHVMVNVPEFMLRVVSEEKAIHETRVVVGAPNHPTPTFSHVMSYLVVNPYWNVPVSIVTKEMLPEIRRDPDGYFRKRGYQVLARAGGKIRVVKPGSIDWSMINPGSVQIRQVPGDLNALGRIKFMFPNQHSVYLHDTPSKSLFGKDYRAYSHGCVRVDNPLDFADSILAVAAPDWNSTRLQKLYGGPERRINLDNPIPVHLSYFTIAVDAEGVLRRFEDIYGYDREMKELLGPLS